MKYSYPNFVFLDSFLKDQKGEKNKMTSLPGNYIRSKQIELTDAALKLRKFIFRNAPQWVDTPNENRFLSDNDYWRNYKEIRANLQGFGVDTSPQDQHILASICQGIASVKRVSPELVMRDMISYINYVFGGRE